MVGRSETSGSSGVVEHAFLYQVGLGMVDLNTLLTPWTSSGWILVDAFDINNSGQIVGWGWLNGAQRAFRLDPVSSPPPLVVPEPASLPLLVSGLGAMGLARRRQA